MREDPQIQDSGSVDEAPETMTLKCCKACGCPSNIGLCSYGCDRVEEAGTFEVRYVRTDRAAEALRKRAEVFTSGRTRGAFYMAADVIDELFGPGSPPCGQPGHVVCGECSTREVSR